MRRTSRSVTSDWGTGEARPFSRGEDQCADHPQELRGRSSHMIRGQGHGLGGQRPCARMDGRSLLPIRNMWVGRHQTNNPNMKDLMRNGVLQIPIDKKYYIRSM